MPSDQKPSIKKTIVNVITWPFRKMLELVIVIVFSFWKSDGE